MRSLSRSETGPQPVMNVTPLVDVVLVLLIIFMVVIPMMEKSAQVELPEHLQRRPRGQGQDRSVHALAHDATATMYFEQDQARRPSACRGRCARPTRTSRAAASCCAPTARAQYGDVRKLFKACQEVGFPGISLRVNELKQGRASPRVPEEQPPWAMDLTQASVGKTGARDARSMNVTPLVDVVLVLLIIFMVITPLLAKQFWLHLPNKTEKEEPPRTGQNDKQPIVVIVDEGRRDQDQPRRGPEGRVSRTSCKRVLAGSGQRTVFFDADEDARVRQGGRGHGPRARRRRRHHRGAHRVDRRQRAVEVVKPGVSGAQLRRRRAP